MAHVENLLHEEVAVLGGGCFWCTEAVYRSVKGVISVESGYAGGRVANPSYEQVCAGGTGHVEVVRVVFDSAQVSYRDILTIFFGTHDPTTLNRQGNDVGDQYASVIFYESPEQRDTAQSVIDELTREQVFSNPIVTRLEPAVLFWPAEAYHQDYLANNPQNGYCQAVVSPKVAKFRSRFKHMLAT